MPEHGETKTEGGLTWRWVDPPGTWVIPTVPEPLRDRDFADLADVPLPDDDHD
jgi:hypothetical protein